MNSCTQLLTSPLPDGMTHLIQSVMVHQWTLKSIGCKANSLQISVLDAHEQMWDLLTGYWFRNLLSAPGTSEKFEKGFIQLYNSKSACK